MYLTILIKEESMNLRESWGEQRRSRSRSKRVWDKNGVNTVPMDESLKIKLINF